VNAAAFMLEEYAPRQDYASAMLLQAHAKLNLALAVDLPVPPSGYHPLCSWFVTLDLADSIRVEPATITSLHVKWAADAPRSEPIEWPMERDLCIKALRTFEMFIGAPCPVSIQVIKRIPVGGGLGGGSSDAAATLLALRTMFAPTMTPTQCAEIASRVGSDVSYFCDTESVIPRRAVVGGFGERVTRTFDHRESAAVLIIPPFGCPTREVYERFDSIAHECEDFGTRCTSVKRLAESRDSISNDDLFNDLSRAAKVVQPRLADVIDVAARCVGKPIHVTGSGSTCFTLASTREAPEIVRMLKMALQPLDCTVVSSNLL